MERGDSSSAASPAASVESSSPSTSADRMELEAAEALADLAHLAMRDGGGVASSSCGGGGGKWGSKGKRANKKRVKSESPPSDPALNPVPPSDLPLDDRSIADQQHKHGEPICADTNNLLNPAKPEQDVNLPQPDLSCGRGFPSYGGGGSRSRQNLTEAEKEARRIRRILANRESARQTIRRRQALCEELNRKAAELVQENENLKREKELALSEYLSLDRTNKHLKAQISEAIKADVQNSMEDHKPVRMEMPTAPAANYPLFLYNQHPFTPFCWPSIIQSANSVQSNHGPQNGIVVQSSIPMLAGGNPDSSQQQQEHSINTNGPRPPLFILSCPWFLPLHDQGNGVQPHSSFGLRHIQDVTSVNNQCSGSSSSQVASVVENQHCSLPIKIEPEAASSKEIRVIADLNEAPVGFPPDGGGLSLGPHAEEVILTPIPMSAATPAIAVKTESGPQTDYASSSNGVCKMVTHPVSNLPEKVNYQDPFKLATKKLVDAAAAAEARRRRKELTKLKNIHGRQCPMNC